MTAETGRVPAATVLAVVVNYNSGDWLKDCVESILDSSVDVTVVVVDNASSDHSMEHLGAVGDRVDIIQNRENVGFSRANNQVMAERDADYYALINPDCIVERDTIEKVIDVMRSDDAVGLTSCLIRNADGSVQKTCRRRFPTPSSALARTLGLDRIHPDKYPDFDYGSEQTVAGVEMVDAVSGAFMVARHAAVDSVGYLDEGYFMHCEDLDWCKRFWQAGYKVAFTGETCVTHAKGASGRSLRVNWHLHQGMLRFYKKFYRREYPGVLFPLVHLGVYASFIGRSTKILFRGQRTNAGGA